MSFSTVLEVALAGTQRTATDALLHDGPDRNAEAPETLLLRAAAFEGLRRLAGRPLPRLDALAGEPLARDPSPAETLPQAPAGAAARLFFLLDQEPELLGEWLQLAVEHRVRAPFAALPELLDLGRSASGTSTGRQRRIREVGGERLGWLAAQNPDWAFAASSENPERLYADGSREQRRQALQLIRESDPKRARELLLASWDAEPPTSRAALLEVLATNLSTDDEPVLERGLAASRKEIRDAAIALLRQLPDSNFAARWRNRARAVIELQRQTPSVQADSAQPAAERLTLEIHAPSHAPEDWIADGLDPALPKGKGATAWLLEQLMRNCPPDLWPLDALDAFLHNVWAAPLVAGLAAAAVAYRHADWCARLIAHAATKPAAQDALPFNVTSVFGALPPARAEALFMTLARTDSALPQRLAGSPLALALDHRWSTEFSRFMLEEYFPARLAAAPYSVVGELRVAGFRLHPSSLPLLQQLLVRTQEPTWLQTLLERLVDTLELRATMRAEFNAAAESAS